MCFYHDYDWYAEVSDDERGFAPADTVRCEECRDRIHPGQRCRRVYQQQYEQCRRCETGDCPPCEDGHDHGEFFECFVCDRCQSLLDAVRKVEQEAGCGYAESQPAFGELREALRQSDHAAEYLEAAARDSPDLAASGHLDRFYGPAWDEDERWPAADLEPVEVYGGEG